MNDSTARFSRTLIRILPRALREEHGDDMVQLACDRRRYRHEPLWRLWPSLLGDALSSAVRLRWEEAMIPTRAILAGLGLAFAAFAALSGGLLIGLPILVVVGLVVLRTAPAPATDARAPRWVPWAVVGVALVSASFAVMAISDDEFSAMEWTAILGQLVLGLWGLGTALVIAIDTHRTPPGPGAPA